MNLRYIPGTIIYCNLSSGSSRESQNRFPYIAWKNKEQSEVSIQSSSTTASSYDRAKSYRRNDSIDGRNIIRKFSIKPRTKHQESDNFQKVEETTGRNHGNLNVLENAVFADDQDYNQEFKESILIDESKITTTIPSIQVQSEKSVSGRDADMQTIVKPVTTRSNISPISDPGRISITEISGAEVNIVEISF